MDCKMANSLRKMFIKTFIILAVTKVSMTVKVNLQGQITMGREVMDTLSFLIDSSPTSGRRSMTSRQEKAVVEIITTKQLCRDFKFCSGSLSQFVEDYLVILTTAVESIFKAYSYEKFTQNDYYEGIDKILRDLKKIFKNVESKINEEKEYYYWNNILKRISGKFHKLVASIMDSQSDPLKQSDENKNLIKKMIVALILIEAKYENKLCNDHGICIKSFECTKALHAILEKLTRLSDDEIRSFIKYLYEALFSSTFYSHLSDVTASQFQVILNDMIHSSDVPTKDLLQSVQETVKIRSELIMNHTNTKLGYDVQLIHMILSDLDHFYSTHNSQPFRDYVKNLVDWSTSGRLGKQLRKLIKEIGNEVTSQSEEVILKVTNEVRVFLELTIDPEK